jgi:hypothetical protein
VSRDQQERHESGGHWLPYVPVVVKNEHDEVAELGELDRQRGEAVVFGVELP